MRKLIVAEHISLDGVVQSPGAPQEDAGGGFALGGWTVPYGDPAIGKFVTDMLAPPFEMLLGRGTYDIFAGYWPKAPAGPIADRFNGAAKHVATHRPGALAWRNSHALSGEIAAAVRALKDRDGPDLLTWGSPGLVRQLLAEGLVDELRLILYPVVLGRGKRLFDGGARPAAFTLAESGRTAGGVMLQRYVRGGEVRAGTFGE